MKRNAIIDLAKLVYAMPILLFHSNLLMQGAYDWRKTEVMPGGYIAVEFFFIISGFLMTASAGGPSPTKDIGEETSRFIFRKIQVLLPYYTVAFLLSFITSHCYRGLTFRIVFHDLIYSFFSFFRVNITGFAAYDPIGPGWYISAMLLGMLALYPLLRTHKSVFIRIIAPLLTLFLYGYISKTRGNLSAGTVWIGVCNVGILRAVSGLSLGCICFEAAHWLKRFSLTIFSRVLLTTAEALSYLLPLIVMCLRKYTQLDFILVFLFAIAITISFSSQSYSTMLFHFSHPRMSEMGLAVYLCHVGMVPLVKLLFPRYTLWERLPYFVLLSLFAGLVCMSCGNQLKQFFERHRDQLQNILIYRAENHNAINSRHIETGEGKQKKQ